jgi:Glycosyl hydrolases family 43/Ricin-type beta-trefoil lectin domain-like
MPRPLLALFSGAALRKLAPALALCAAPIACGREEGSPLDAAAGKLSFGGNGGSAGAANRGGSVSAGGGSGDSGAPSGGNGNSGGGAGSSASGATQGGGASGGAGSSGSPTGGGAGDGGALGRADWPLVNGVQWADTDGEPIQAHGGGLLEADGHYYWFGENRNPDGSFHAVSAYRSRDLVRWEFAHDVLRQDSAPGLDPANVERPKVVYNAATHQYVMWMHWENGAGYGEARAAVASSDTVDGDYTYHGSFRPLVDSGVVDHSKPGYMSRDCNLFVDDDGKGYFISATNENYDLNLYELTPDYLQIQRLVATLFKGGHREAPALFKRNGVYFLLTSGATGWSPNQAQYATSDAIGSGWSSMKNVGDGNTFYSQSTYVLPIQGSNGTSYLYLGDRWAGAWGGRVNDSTYVWQPLTFPSATSMSMSWSNTLSIDVNAGTVSGATNNFRLLNVKSGKALDVEGAGDEDSADLVQNAVGDADSQVWSFNYDGAGFFRLTNLKSKKVIDVPDASTSDGVELVQWEGNDGDNQAWLLVDLGQGIFKLKNKNSGRFASVVQASTEDGAAVEQRAAGDGDEQRWRVVPD